MKSIQKVHLVAALLGTVLILILLAIAAIFRMRHTDPGTTAPAQPGSIPGEPVPITPYPTLAEGFGSTSPEFKILSAQPDSNTPIATSGGTLTITVSQPITTTGIRIEFDPPTLYGYQVTGNSVRIRFVKPLLPGRQYAYAITKDTGEVAFGLFQSAGPTPTPGIMVNDPAINETIDRLQLQENPDLYLHNRLPYESDQFRIDSELRTDPETYYAFRVESRDGSDVRADAEAWMRSIGLPQTAIDRLTITYE